MGAEASGAGRRGRDVPGTGDGFDNQPIGVKMTERLGEAGSLLPGIIPSESQRLNNSALLQKMSLGDEHVGAEERGDGEVEKLDR
jgi:hypothetical protein